MKPEKKIHAKVKSGFHERSKHRGRYDFNALIAASEELAEFVFQNKYDDETIDFSRPEAVKALNTALLKHHYGLTYWDIPPNYLCPPIPSRADYVHHLADLLADGNRGEIPTGSKIKCLDVGVGANCIYPIVGNSEYGWSFVGTDTDAVSIASAQKIVDENPTLKGNIELRTQTNASDIFHGIMHTEEFFDLVFCNPPFHGSIEEAEEGSLRKVQHLKGTKSTKVALNFGGQTSELVYPGGELAFVKGMIRESRYFAKSVFWFSTLISKHENLGPIYNALRAVEAIEVKTIRMNIGNKQSRIVAWTFLE